MQQVSCVHVLESLEQLVHDVLLVHLLEDVRANDRMQIGVCSNRVFRARGSARRRSRLNAAWNSVPMYSKTRYMSRSLSAFSTLYSLMMFSWLFSSCHGSP